MIRHHCDVEFRPDRVRITNRRTGRTVDRVDPIGFSSGHRLIADRKQATRFVHDVLIELNQRKKSFALWPTADFTIAEGPQTPADAEDVAALLRDLGFVTVRFVAAPATLTDEAG